MNIPIKSENLSNLRLVQEKIRVEKKESTETYVRARLIKLGIEVERTKERNGAPDFFCNYKGLNFYVEVKGDDGLRYSQIKWIINNPKEIVYVYFLNQDTRAEYEKSLIK